MRRKRFSSNAFHEAWPGAPGLCNHVQCPVITHLRIQP